MKRIYLWLSAALLVALWSWQLGSFPGLHADEAWGGLKAYRFLTLSQTDAFGMNHYTGAMQSLFSALFFKSFGVGVSSLRITGVVFNVLGLFLLISLLEKRKRRAAYLFLLLLLQSAMWLLYPRIAWEVCSFTLFFVSSFFFVYKKTALVSRPKTVWVFLFFMVGLLSSYNHILFSCISAAYLLTHIILAVLKGELFLKTLYIPFMNIMNISILFGCMNAFEGSALREYPFTVFLSFIFLLFIEALLLAAIPQKTFSLVFCSTKCRRTIGWMLSIGASTFFIYFHGPAVMDSMIAAKVFQHVLGFSSNKTFTVFSLVMAVLVMGAFLFYLIKDIKNNTMSFFLIFVLCYVLLFPLYTQDNSPRYYLALQLFFFIYIAFKIDRNRWIPLFLIASCCVNMYFLITVYTHRNYPFTAQEVFFGRQEETSQHFKPISPLLDSLQKYEVKDIHYADKDNRYFLEQPIRFMELIRPWNKEEETAVIIDYGVNPQNGGFIWVRTDEK